MKFQLARCVAGLRAKYKNWKGFLKRKKKTKKGKQFFFKETTTKKKGGGKKKKKINSSLQLICIEHRLHKDNFSKFS